MSSITFENYEQGNIIASYQWNKGDGFETTVGIVNDCRIVSVLFRGTYATKEQAKRAYQRQVRKIKNGDYEGY